MEMNMTSAISDMSSLASTTTNLSQLEVQLSNIIASSKQISIIAEELLREFSALDIAGSAGTISPGRMRQALHAAAVAPRLLAATQQQLESLGSMLSAE
jgi:hypothetical protein